MASTSERNEVPRYLLESTVLFDDDLAGEINWWMKEFGIEAVAKLLDSIEGAKLQLERFPEFRPHVYGLDYRWIPMGRHIAVYRVDKERRRVVLLRLFNMKSDWRSKLLGNQTDDSTA